MDGSSSFWFVPIPNLLEAVPMTPAVQSSAQQAASQILSESSRTTRPPCLSRSGLAGNKESPNPMLLDVPLRCPFQRVRGLGHPESTGSRSLMIILNGCGLSFNAEESEATTDKSQRVAQVAGRQIPRVNRTVLRRPESGYAEKGSHGGHGGHVIDQKSMALAAMRGGPGTIFSVISWLRTRNSWPRRLVY